MIFTLEPTIASLILFDGALVTLEAAVPREKFATDFAGLELTNVRQLSYEPEKGYYHIIDASGNLHAYSGASENELLSWVENNWDSLVSYFEQVRQSEINAEQQ